MNSIEATTLLQPQWDALKATLAQIKNLPAAQAQELAALLDELTPAAAEFIATSDERHLKIIEFRLRTFGRDANFEALKLSDQAMYEAVLGALRSVAAAATLL